MLPSAVAGLPGGFPSCHPAGGIRVGLSCRKPLTEALRVGRVFLGEGRRLNGRAGRHRPPPIQSFSVRVLQRPTLVQAKVPKPPRMQAHAEAPLFTNGNK